MLLLLLSHFSRAPLCDPIDGSPPGSAVPGILRARTLEWVAISFSKAWKWKVKVKSLSLLSVCLTLSDPMDCSLPGSSIHGIFQARVLEWGAIAFSVRWDAGFCFSGFRSFLGFFWCFDCIVSLWGVLVSSFAYSASKLCFCVGWVFHCIRLGGERPPSHGRGRSRQVTSFHLLEVSMGSWGPELGQSDASYHLRL